MAIVKTIQIHSEDGICKVQDYIENPEKTDLGNLGIHLELTYDRNPDKTAMKGASGISHTLVDGYKCSPLNAAGQFYDVRRLYESRHAARNYQKKKPVVAIHLIQSFSHDETLDPRLVHQIGMELVEGLKHVGLGDYQAVVSTHMNTDHLHNHILLNAFSADGISKFHDNQKTLQQIRDLSDEISLKYGLPILHEEDHIHSRSVSRSIGEHYARLDGESWKEQFRTDIRACIESSGSFREWYSSMKFYGYTFRETADGIPISISDGQNTVRLQRLGEKFTYEGIVKAIAEKAPRGFQSYFERHSERTAHSQSGAGTYDWIPYFEKVKRYSDFGRRRSDLEMILLTLLQYLKRILARMRATPQKEFDKSLEGLINQTEKQIHDLEHALELSREYQIQDTDDIQKRKKSVGHSLSDMKKMISALSVNCSALQAAVQPSLYSTNSSERTDNGDNSESDNNESVHPLSGNKASAADDTPHTLLASLSPLTPIQRRDLFSLSKDSGWRVNASFGDITASEAADAITFLKTQRSRVKDQASTDCRTPLLFKSGYRPQLITPTTVQLELTSVSAQLRICRQREDELSHEYKNLIFLEKVLTPAQDEYYRLSKEREEYERQSVSSRNKSQKGITR